MKGKNWYGVAPNLLRAYAWIMSLGAGGLREVAEVALLNHNRRSNASDISVITGHRDRTMYMVAAA